MEILVLDRCDDVNRLLPLVQSAIAGIEIGVPLNAGVVLRTIKSVISSNRGDGIVLQDNGHIVGGVLMVYSLSLVGPGTIADEVLLYVDPAARGVGGIMLLLAAQRLATARGCDFLLLSHAGGTERAGRLFGRLGYKPFGASYIRGCNG